MAPSLPFLKRARSRPVLGLNRPKRVRHTDNGIHEPTCLCGYRVWVERGKRRRRPDSGAAYLGSVGPVTVLYYPSLCRSSSPRQTYGAAVGCSKLLTFQTSSKSFPELAKVAPEGRHSRCSLACLRRAMCGRLHWQDFLDVGGWSVLPCVQIPRHAAPCFRNDVAPSFRELTAP